MLTHYCNAAFSYHTLAPKKGFSGFTDLIILVATLVNYNFSSENFEISMKTQSFWLCLLVMLWSSKLRINKDEVESIFNVELSPTFTKLANFECFFTFFAFLRQIAKICWITILFSDKTYVSFLAFENPLRIWKALKKWKWHPHKNRLAESKYDSVRATRRCSILSFQERKPFGSGCPLTKMYKSRRRIRSSIDQKVLFVGWSISG